MDNVMAKYRSIAQSPMQKLMYDQGEDRLGCPLSHFTKMSQFTEIIQFTEISLFTEIS